MYKLYVGADVMRKADKEEFYRLVDSMKYLIDTNNLISKKDIYYITNELIDLKLRLQDKNRAFH